MITISGVGRVGKDPVMQFDPKGGAVTRLSVAVDCGFGEYKRTVWVSLVSFGKQAEILKEYLTKGSRLMFTAEVTDNRSYEYSGKQGVSLDAKVLTFKLLDKVQKNEENAEPEAF